MAARYVPSSQPDDVDIMGPSLSQASTADLDLDVGGDAGDGVAADVRLKVPSRSARGGGADVDDEEDSSQGVTSELKSVHVAAPGGWKTDNVFDVLTIGGGLILPYGCNVRTAGGQLKPNVTEVVEEDGFRFYVFNLPANDFLIPEHRKKADFPKEAAVMSEHNERLLVTVRCAPS